MIGGYQLLSRMIMYKKLILINLVNALIFLSMPMIAEASEYCVRRFEGDINKVSADLSAVLIRQAELDKLITQSIVDRDAIAGQIAQVIASDSELASEASRKKIAELSKIQSSKKIEQDKWEAEGHVNNEKVVQLRGVVPASLQGELKGCLSAVTPANKIVNFAIQAVALVATAGASTSLHEKALYVDMGEVLHGKPFGGDKALIPKARDQILDGLGIGGDAKKVFKDPKCIFGC